MAARLPAQCATVGQVLQDNGYSTFWLGKNHNVPEEDVSSGGSKSEWPLQKGFDRFYGFLGGETNQWFPDLVEDNRFVEQPYLPDEGYHLSKDLTDTGFSEYTDAQVGRIVEYLEQTGQLENTIVFYCADNGASGEGSPNGSVNENKFFNGYPDELSENMKYLNTLGSPDTYNHYPTGWATAFSTPFPDFQALRAVRRWNVRPDGDLLAQGHQIQGAGA